MFKRKKEVTQMAIEPELFRPIKADPIKSAAAQIGNLAAFLRDEVDDMGHKVIIETDEKVIEINVSVRSVARDSDERKSDNNSPAGDG